MNIPCVAWASSPKARAGCGNSARPDPWRGSWVTMIPTPTLRKRNHPRDVQILSIVARFRDHQAGEIQPAPVLDVFGIYVVSGLGDLQRELVGGAEEPGAAITDLHVDAEALAPFAVDLADVDHAAN